MTQNIQVFLDERKELWLKERLKKAENDAVVAELQQQATEKYSLAEWLPDAAKRAKQLTIVSHPAKFSHPRAQVSDIIFSTKHVNDGFLRSGNTSFPFDIVGNAAAIDVYKFLSIKLDDGLNILEHFELKTEIIKKFLSLNTEKFEEIRSNFLEIKSSNSEIKTDKLVKQIYFPLEHDKYHLLSLLTPSGLLVEIKNRINNMRFSEQAKESRENFKNKKFDSKEFTDVYNTSIVAYGSGNPQGISILNNVNSGKYYLLSSTPPKLEKRSIRLPKTDFFMQCLYRKSFQENFITLHNLMEAKVSNDNIRTAIRNIIKFVIDRILLEAFKIREHYPQGWSEQDYYVSLPRLQRIWLDNMHKQHREDDQDWRNELAQDIARWILRSYEKVIQDAFKLGDGELLEVKNAVHEAVKLDKEFF